MTRVLIAGFGNQLRGDDGFGIEVIAQLERAWPFADDVHVDLLEVGTAGIRLVQHLLTRYDRLIVIDAMRGGGPPGSVYVHEVETLPAPAAPDPHLTVPGPALAMAQALAILPSSVHLIGCEPSEVDELSMELSNAVRAAVGEAADAAARLVGGSIGVSEASRASRVIGLDHE